MDQEATIQVRTRAKLKQKLEEHAKSLGMTKVTRFMWIAMAEKAERDGNIELRDEILAQM